MPDVRFAVIAAAGIGARLGRGTPKCLIEVGGNTLLGHLLERLRPVEVVHISVGFMAEEVMKEALRHRPDAVFVMNRAFRSTTTLTSYVCAAAGIMEPVLYMDADIYFTKDSFSGFLAEAARHPGPMIGVTSAKTEHCVFVERDQYGNAIAFSRSRAADVEWANVAWLPPGMLTDAPVAVFEQLVQHLPIRTCEVESYEVDTPDDYDLLLSQFMKASGDA